MFNFLDDKETWVMRYLDGELNADELQNFNNALQTDPALKEELDQKKLAIEAIRFYGTREKVKTIHQAMRGEVIPSEQSGRKAPIRKIVRRSMAVAASVLLIFIVIQAYYFYMLSPEGLYRNTYIAYNVSASRGETIEISQIEKEFSERNYASVISLAKKDTELTNREQFLASLSFLEMNDAASAITWFKKLNKENNPYQQDAQFYLSLSHLRNKDYDHALHWMQNINNDTSHVYHEQVSKKIIREIKMLKWK